MSCHGHALETRFVCNARYPYASIRASMLLEMPLHVWQAGCVRESSLHRYNGFDCVILAFVPEFCILPQACPDWTNRGPFCGLSELQGSSCFTSRKVAVTLDRGRCLGKICGVVRTQYLAHAKARWSIVILTF
jgi:hypothetical protein